MIKFERNPASPRYRGIPYMNEFRSVKQRDDAWDATHFRPQSLSIWLRIRRTVARFDNDRCGAVGLCNRLCAVDRSGDLYAGKTSTAL
jgi:hypothetical protein